MSETLSVLEAADILREGVGNITQIDNDPFISFSYVPIDEHQKSVRDKDLGDSHYGMPREHPPKRDKYLLPKYVESIKFERGNPDDQYDPDFLILTSTYPLGKKELSNSYFNKGFFVHQEQSELEKSPLCIHVRKPYSVDPVLPDVKIYDNLIEFKLNKNLEKLFAPSEIYFEAARKLEHW